MQPTAGQSLIGRHLWQSNFFSFLDSLTSVFILTTVKCSKFFLLINIFRENIKVFSACGFLFSGY